MALTSRPKAVSFPQYVPFPMCTSVFQGKSQGSSKYCISTHSCPKFLGIWASIWWLIGTPCYSPCHQVEVEDFLAEEDQHMSFCRISRDPLSQACACHPGHNPAERKAVGKPPDHNKGISFQSGALYQNNSSWSTACAVRRQSKISSWKL